MSVYETIDLVENRSVWSLRWQHCFDRMEVLGTAFATVRMDLPGADADTDLGHLQHLLRDARAPTGRPPSRAVRGDGSLLLLRGETPTELGELAAAILKAGPSGSGTLVVRCSDAAPLERPSSAMGYRPKATRG